MARKKKDPLQADAGNQKHQPERPKLNPPIFEYAPISMRNPNIAWGFSLEKMEFKTFFR